jgi:predicted metal-dependent hydrolase
MRITRLHGNGGAKTVCWVYKPVKRCREFVEEVKDPVGQKVLQYKVKRSNRKTMAVHITKDALVEVRAPLKLPLSEIERFVRDKEKWITENLTEQSNRIAKKAEFSLNYGDSLTVMGKTCAITAVQGNRAGYEVGAFYSCPAPELSINLRKKNHKFIDNSGAGQLYMPPGLNNAQIKDICVKIYKLLAKNELNKRVADYARKMDVAPLSVKINSAVTRWGSCSGRNRLNFSWRLIMADENVIDYVVVHELCHIKQHNHSPKFWAEVENVLPDYKELQFKLKELQLKLAKEDWE